MLFTDISTARVVRALTKKGFRIVGGKKHVVMSDGSRFVTIPRHNRINPFTLKSIIRGSGLTDEEFKSLI